MLLWRDDFNIEAYFLKVFIKLKYKMSKPDSDESYDEKREPKKLHNSITAKVRFFSVRRNSD